MIERLRHVVGDRADCERCGPLTDAHLVFECRRCGATLDGDADRCPVCEHETVVRHELR